MLAKQIRVDRGEKPAFSKSHELLYFVEKLTDWARYRGRRSLSMPCSTIIICACVLENSKAKRALCELNIYFVRISKVGPNLECDDYLSALRPVLVIEGELREEGGDVIGIDGGERCRSNEDEA